MIGAGGRMGASVCDAVTDAPDLDLVAAVDPAGALLASTHLPGGMSGASASLKDGSPGTLPGPLVSSDIASIGEVGAQVAVDFTVAAAALENAAWCADNGVHLVIGTTGLGAAGLARLEELFPAGGPLGCVLAANFAIGAVLMMRFAEMAAPWFDTAEIIELHHDAKVDAPSGTAIATADRMAAASGQWGADPTESEVLPGARGGSGAGGIRIHSVRMRGMVAHQEVILGTAGQTLTIRHDSIDRRSFMPGVLAAVRRVSSRPGVTVGLEPILFE